MPVQVGKITSCIDSIVGRDSGHFGLGCIRKHAAGGYGTSCKQAGVVGLKVPGVPGVVVDVPFASMSLLSKITL